MPNRPLITIVTPSYNQGRFIAETIESVLSQAGDFYIEYIIMDGGSTDNSVEVIKKYDSLLKDGKWPVKCLGVTYSWTSGKDKGQSDAINKGFALSKGEIVAWLNSDDTYIPDAFKKVVDYFKAHEEVMMVYGEGYEIDGADRCLRKFPYTQPFDMHLLVSLHDYILQPTVFVRKAALDRVGLLDENLNWCMDWDLWIRIGRECKVVYLPDFLANSRIYENTKTKTGGLKRFNECVALMRRYSKKRYPPGYISYGRATVEEILSDKIPFYSFSLRHIVNFCAFILSMLLKAIYLIK